MSLPSIWALNTHQCMVFFDLIVTLDGEDVIDCEPILGYLHRGMEKIAENR
nr:NdhH [Agrostis capillaris]